MALYDVMRSLSCPVRTICVGQAHGEAALLLSAGRRGQRAALPSASIMLRSATHGMGRAPVDDIDVFRREIRHSDATMVRAGWGREDLTDARRRHGVCFALRAACDGCAGSCGPSSRRGEGGVVVRSMPAMSAP